FTGPTVQAIMAKLFTEPAPSLRDFREETPEWLEQAVQKALAKAPADRFETASQMAQALTWPAGSTPPGTPSGAGAAKSIAVLPFVNMSADPETSISPTGSPRRSSTR
ncbi:MAG: hypothetical protein V3S83_04310, partial [Gemmatimonadota bacterium]